MSRARLLAFLGPLALLGACGGDSGGNEVKVGLVLPMTGGQATYGEETKNGFLLAYDELKAKGALKVPLKLEWRDEQSEPEAAGDAAKSLIDTAGVHVVIGTVASGHTRRVFQECKEAGVPGITPASTNDQITIEGGEYCSRICFKDTFQGSVLAKFALQRGWKRAAVAEDKSAPYAVGLSEAFRKVYEAGGGVVTREFYETKDTDYANLVQNVANAKPDVIVAAGYYTQVGLMLKQAIGSWDGIPVIGGDGLDSAEFRKLKGSAKNVVFFSSHFAAADANPVVQEFTKKYRERYGKEPGAMAALGYDVMLVLSDVLGRVKDPRDRKQLKDAINATKGVSCVTGTIDLTAPDRTPAKAAVMLEMTEDAFRYVSTFPAN
jgi:branched-chain amino acid transport system substrate-binding protein